jgi:hypothetical protein
MVEKCKNCEYFDRFQGQDVGTCMRFPPILMIDRASDVRDPSYWAQPVAVRDRPACGEFKLKES